MTSLVINELQSNIPFLINKIKNGESIELKDKNDSEAFALIIPLNISDKIKSNESEILNNLMYDEEYISSLRKKAKANWLTDINHEEWLNNVRGR
jgi:hypothetical protein